MSTKKVSPQEQLSFPSESISMTASLVETEDEKECDLSTSQVDIEVNPIYESQKMPMIKF